MIRVPDGYREITLDFEQIVPMPTIVKQTGRSNNSDLGIEILTGAAKPGLFNWSALEFPWMQELGITTLEQLRAWAEKERPEALEEGRKALEAYDEAGFYDWYDWSVANWGTNWNSYGFEIDREAPGELRFRVDTAWSFPTPIFEKLAEMFPSLRFDCTCFDESWNFAGQGTFNGDRPFEIVEATDELFETVFGWKPEYESEPIEEGDLTSVDD